MPDGSAYMALFLSSSAFPFATSSTCASVTAVRALGAARPNVRRSSRVEDQGKGTYGDR